jgi:hypothetical protein
MSKENQDQILEKYKKSIIQTLESIQNDYKTNLIIPNTLYELNNFLTELKNKKIKTDLIDNQITNEHLYVFLCLLQEEGTRTLGLKILKNNIEIHPPFTKKLVNKMFPMIICKILEDFKSKNFNDRYECLKLINSWFQLSNNNFPFIFCQGIAAMSKNDEIFKKGCLEFLRILSIIRPDLCSSVGGFKILINSLLDVNNYDIQDYILYSLLYVINSPDKRKYFNGFDDFYKIFSVFTKSDFTNKNSPKDKNTNKNNDPNAYENEKKRIELSKNVIKKLLKTWTGYLLIMGDYMALGSVIEALNTDTDDLIKSTVLNMFNEILNEEYDYIDNFINISSSSRDYFYTNKIFFAYIFQGLEQNNFYSNIMKFIENGNKTYNDFAHSLALKYIILYSKISKTYLKLPFLNEKLRNEFEQKKQENNDLKLIYQKEMDLWENQYKEIAEEDLLDKIFYHFLSKDLSYINAKNLSTEVILALHTLIINFQSNKKYTNQYSIESCNKELYSIDDKSFNKLLIQSKVLDTKEYIKWDWGHIDSILEVIDNKKLISERQAILKKLLYFYYPSKNEFVNNFWKSGKSEANKEFLVDSFSYGSIGNKLFTILASCPEGIIVLKNKDDFVEDVINCLKNCLNENRKAIQVFGIEQIYSKMSRNIFTFIGILSSTLYGDEYLEEKGFYSMLDKFVDSNNKFDYLLATIIDNINFNSKNVNEWISKLISKGSPQIKRYIFDHIRCIFQLKKELTCDINLLLNSFSTEKENCNNVIISILTSILVRDNNNYEINLTPELIEKISKIDKKLLFIMMRNKDCFELMEDFIQKEIKDINVDDLVVSYGNYLEESTIKIINAKGDDNKDYNVFLTITLSQIEEQYNKIHEFFVLKQLPFYIIIIIKDKESKNIRERYILNSHMEYFSNDKIILYGKPRDNVNQRNIDFRTSTVNFLWKLGDVNIDRMGKYYTGNLDELLVPFGDNELNQKIEIPDNPGLIKLEKEGITLILKEDQNNKGTYSLYSIYCNIKINPHTKQYFKTPINILTELPNNEKGTETLINIGAVEKLLNYLDNDNIINKDIKNIKSALWMLAKILIRDETGKIEKKYQIIQKILKFNEECSDYGMKGNIVYILCFISQKPSIKEYLKLNGYSYFFNTDICYPNDMNKLYIDKTTSYDNNKIKKDGDIINKKIVLSKESEAIYSNITNLINNIWSKTASIELDDIYKREPHLFNDPNLFIKVYAALSRHKFKQPVRRKILQYFDNCLTSPEIIENASKILGELGEDLLLSSELE